MARTKPTNPGSAQRKFLRGEIADVCLYGPEGNNFTDAFPPEVLRGERVRTFLAASSWFWYCYTCFQNDGG